jgi:hypothetical protein
MSVEIDEKRMISENIFYFKGSRKDEDFKQELKIKIPSELFLSLTVLKKAVCLMNHFLYIEESRIEDSLECLNGLSLQAHSYSNNHQYHLQLAYHHL